MSTLAEDLAGVMDVATEAMQGWAEPLPIVDIPLDKLLEVRPGPGKHPHLAYWWAAGQVRELTEALAAYRLEAPAAANSMTSRCSAS